MKLTKAQLRKLVRANLLETPLMDIYPYKNRRAPNQFISTVPSVGYRLPSALKGTTREKRNQFTTAAKVLLADSEDSWYIIVFKNIGYNNYHPTEIVESPEFLQWMNSLNIPKGSKILVVGQGRIKGDYLAPEWQIAHDIIGHTILQHYRENMKGNFEIEGYEEIFNSFENSEEEHLNITWMSLPSEFKISKRNPNDRLPDILAAVFANKFNKQKAVELYRNLNIFNMEDVNNSLDALYKIVESWKMSIPYDTPTIVNPF